MKEVMQIDCSEINFPNIENLSIIIKEIRNMTNFKIISILYADYFIKTYINKESPDVVIMSIDLFKVLNNSKRFLLKKALENKIKILFS